MSETKQCSNCGETKLLDLFRSRRNKCRACESKNSCAWAKRNPKKVRQIKNSARGKYLEKARELNLLSTAVLSDRYVKQTIHLASGLPYEKITDELVNVKRKHLQILREIKGKQNDKRNKNT